MHNTATTDRSRWQTCHDWRTKPALRIFPAILVIGITLSLGTVTGAQNSETDKPAAEPKSPGSKSTPGSISKKDADPETELQKAIASASNDRSALVRNLKNYLERFPDAPRKASVYRALVESCEQVQDEACALDYSERLIAIRPDDSEMMMLAVGLLQQQADEASLTRAAGYVTRVLDRIEKSAPDDKSPRMSLEDWREHQDEIRAALYNLRGQIEKSQHDYDAAGKDLRTSYSILPSAVAAEQLGELAEMHHDSASAMDQYILAFVLPESGPAGKVDRREIRKKLGNVWRQVHGNDEGLGQAILAAYDSQATPLAAASPVARNKDAKDTYAFVLRNLDGTPAPLAAAKGKTLVLSFWATWCGPCKELEPEFAHVAKNYAGNEDIVFYAVNTDEDQSLVPRFIAHEKWNVPIIYADGLDDFMKVNSLPTVVILDRTGKVTYRVNGYPPVGFTEDLTAAIQSATAAKILTQQPH
ncbi:MAG: TlpA disulfide reductase family protein [Candidatus Acidiferrales bacterium]